MKISPKHRIRLSAALIIATGSIFVKIPFFWYGGLLLFLIVTMQILTGRHIAFIVFLMTYGLFSRSFTGLDSTLWNPVFVIPPLYALLYSDRILLSIKKMNRGIIGAVFIYTGIGMYSVIRGHILPSSVSFAAVILPIFYFMHIEDDVLKIAGIAAIPVILYAFMQYYGIMLPVDRAWLEWAYPERISSVYLGANLRPFSVFTSPEEFSSFAAFIVFLPLFRKGKVYIAVSVAALAALIFFSYRTGIAFVLLYALFACIARGRWKWIAAAAVIGSVILAVGISTPETKDIARTDKGPGVTLRHITEPIRHPGNIYSLNRRISILKENVKSIKENPMGYGLTHNHIVTGNKFNNTGTESSFMQLAVSAGIPMIIFLLFIYTASAHAIWKNRKNEYGYGAFAALFFIMMSHGLSLHFLAPVLYMYIIKVFEKNENNQ